MIIKVIKDLMMEVFHFINHFPSCTDGIQNRITDELLIKRKRKEELRMN
jgi:hypothetical protein